MPTTFKSPYATTFNNAVRRGVPCSVAVENIAKRNKKTVNNVFQSLYKAGCCYRQKMNGQWIYWPVNGVKGNATNHKCCQVNMWQCFVDWCICSGTCTPEQICNCCGSQTDFMKSCKKFWNKQFTTIVTKTRTTRGTKTRTSRTTTSRSYSFNSGRKLRRAA
ncbi:MAG: hypothetical protein ACYTJ0_13015 [Planctomycetota bacterium]|jgi:hypothetical protein